jgi:hypothetical protein
VPNPAREVWPTIQKLSRREPHTDLNPDEVVAQSLESFPAANEVFRRNDFGRNCAIFCLLR